MTLEELEQLKESQDQLIKALKEDKETLAKNQKEQNSHITKLEAELQQLRNKSSNQAQGTTIEPQLSKPFTDYLQKNMKRDTIEEALSLLAQQGTGADVLDCMKPELMEFLNNTMTIDKTKTSYVVDAFHLLYGKAMANKDHVIHKLGQQQGGVQGNPPPVQQSQSQVAGQQTLAQRMQAVMPPIMTPNDVNAAQTPPQQNGEQIKSTKDAMSSFKKRIINAGGNRFS